MTLQEIQYKAQGIIHKWRDDDSAPYIEFVEELAHMIVPEPSEDLEEAANKFAVFYDQGTCDGIAQDCFKAGAEWQKEQDDRLVDIIYQQGIEKGKDEMRETLKKKKKKMNEVPHPGFDKPEEYETFTTTNGLEEAADNHIRKVVDAAGHPGWDWTTQDIAEAFVAGAKWQKEQYHFFNEAWADDMQAELDRNYENGKLAMKEQMMSEAVEGEISSVDVGDDSYVKSLKMSELQKAIRNYNVGDKIKIIIVKED